MSGISLSEEEIRALYGLLKGHEGRWDATIGSLLLRIERYLYGRMTIEEIDQLKNLETPGG